MSDLAQSYTSLNAASSRVQVANVLQSITNTPFLQSSTRNTLIQNLIDDLALCCSGNSISRLTTKDAGRALTALKVLGKNPSASEIISSTSNFSTLFSIFKSLKDDEEASNEVLRCIANAMLLVDKARATLVSKDVGGGDVCVKLLQDSTNSERIFLASRILFLSTASAAYSGSYIRSLVEDKKTCQGGDIVNIIGTKLDLLSGQVTTNMKMSREAMTDLLKFTFNLLVHYPKIADCEPQDSHSVSSDDDTTKVMGDFWSSKLDGILPPLLRVFHALPPSPTAPLAAPLTHVIHSLITIPVSPALRPVWFNTSSGSKSGYNSDADAPLLAAKQLSESASRGDSPTSSPVKESKPGAFDRAMSVIAAGRRTLSRSSSPQPPSTPPQPPPAAPDVLLRAQRLLDPSLAYYMPGDVDPDDPSVRERCKRDGESSMDEMMVPLVVLITRLCISDEPSRVRTREWIVPSDLDRSRSLEGRADVLGRCLRLLGSVYHSRLKDAVGEMLFAICDSNATSLASHFGYGNVAGFLYHKGIMQAPVPHTDASAGPSTTPDGVEIDPITGVARVERELPEMTEEEKQQETEKLFVLMDRLEKTGAIQPSSNPIRKAIQEGKLGPG